MNTNKETKVLAKDGLNMSWIRRKWVPFRLQNMTKKTVHFPKHTDHLKKFKVPGFFSEKKTWFSRK